jgi:hypothetical protein
MAQSSSGLQYQRVISSGNISPGTVENMKKHLSLSVCDIRGGGDLTAGYQWR